MRVNENGERPGKMSVHPQCLFEADKELRLRVWERGGQVGFTCVIFLFFGSSHL